MVSGDAPVYAILRAAHDRAKAVGAKDTDERAIIGAPVEASVELAEEVDADLLVGGQLGRIPSPIECWGRCLLLCRVGPPSMC